MRTRTKKNQDEAGVPRMKITRVWAMPDKWTFRIKPIERLLKEEIRDRAHCWVDPFAGMNSPAYWTNDINSSMPSLIHMDALEFLDSMLRKKRKYFLLPVEGVLFDPPYSPRQFKECYEAMKLKTPFEVFNAGYLAKCRDRIGNLVKPGGKVISFGWNSNGAGKKRGFDIERVLLVAHGGGHNDTIVTVERKIQESLE